MKLVGYQCARYNVHNKQFKRGVSKAWSFAYAVRLVLICHAAVLTRKSPEVKCVSIKLFIILSLPKALVDSNMLTHCLL